MEARLKVLELFLSALGENANIDSLDNRLRVQKAVYLGQLFGADLGYRYSWYVKGPYCPALTQDYFELDQQGDDNADHGLKLNEEVAARLQRARAFLELPQNIEISKPQWFELLASLHYLKKVSRLEDDAVEKTIAEKKPHLTKWIEVGKNRLQAFGLVN